MPAGVATMRLPSYAKDKLPPDAHTTRLVSHLEPR